MSRRRLAAFVVGTVVIAALLPAAPAMPLPASPASEPVTTTVAGGLGRGPAETVEIAAWGAVVDPDATWVLTAETGDVDSVCRYTSQLVLRRVDRGTGHMDVVGEVGCERRASGLVRSRGDGRLVVRADERLLRIDTATGHVQTVPFSPLPGRSYVCGDPDFSVAALPNGRVAFLHEDTVQVVDESTGRVEKLAEVKCARGLAASPHGDVFVGSTQWIDGDLLWRIAADGTATVFAGEGSKQLVQASTAAEVNFPPGGLASLAANNRYLYLMGGVGHARIALDTGSVEMRAQTYMSNMLMGVTFDDRSLWAHHGVWAEGEEGPELLAGTGAWGRGSGNGGAAVDARLPGASHVAYLPDGGFVVNTPWSLRRVGSDGTISTLVAQDRHNGAMLPEGSHPSEVTLPEVVLMTADPHGNLYLYLTTRYRSSQEAIWRLDAADGLFHEISGDVGGVVNQMQWKHGRLLVHRRWHPDVPTGFTTWLDPKTGEETPAAAQDPRYSSYRDIGAESFVERPPTASTFPFDFAVPGPEGQVWLVGRGPGFGVEVRLTRCGFETTVAEFPNMSMERAWGAPDGALLLSLAGQVKRIAPDGSVTDVSIGPTGGGFDVRADGTILVTTPLSGPATQVRSISGALTMTESISPPYGCELGTLHAVPPSRLLDTRDGARSGRGAIAPRGEVVLQVNGRGGVPDQGVDSVALNVTAVSATNPGYVSVRPGDAAGPPETSNINVLPGDTRATLAVVRVAPDGTVRLTNGTGAPLHLVVDVSGWYADGSVDEPAGTILHGVVPGPDVQTRVLDTRRPGSGGAIRAFEQRRVAVAGLAGLPTSGVEAVALNVTVTEPLAYGHLTAWGAGAAPLASVLNFSRGQTVANQVVVPVAPDGTIGLQASASAHAIVDVSGWYGSGDGDGSGRVIAQKPRRLLDTREQDWWLGAGWQSEEEGSAELEVAGVAGVPLDGADAVVLSVTAVDATAESFLTVWPGGSARPEASSLNLRGGETVANLVTVPLGPDGTVNVYNHAGETDLIVDVMGWVTAGETG